MQLSLELIPHQVGPDIIQQRAKDGYINATAMCKAAGKRWPDYNRLGTTTAFLNELSSVVQIPTSELIQTLTGGVPELQGTWVHPRVAVHLAQWLSPEFAVKVSGWVYDWMSGSAQPKQAVLPYHVRRFAANFPNVPARHFSILTELTQVLIGPLEMLRRHNGLEIFFCRRTVPDGWRANRIFFSYCRG